MIPRRNLKTELCRGLFKCEKHRNNVDIIDLPFLGALKWDNV